MSEEQKEILLETVRQRVKQDWQRNNMSDELKIKVEEADSYLKSIGEKPISIVAEESTAAETVDNLTKFAIGATTVINENIIATAKTSEAVDLQYARAKESYVSLANVPRKIANWIGGWFGETIVKVIKYVIYIALGMFALTIAGFFCYKLIFHESIPSEFKHVHSVAKVAASGSTSIFNDFVKIINKIIGIDENTSDGNETAVDKLFNYIVTLPYFKESTIVFASVATIASGYRLLRFIRRATRR